MGIVPGFVSVVVVVLGKHEIGLKINPLHPELSETSGCDCLVLASCTQHVEK